MNSESLYVGIIILVTIYFLIVILTTKNFDLNFMYRMGVAVVIVVATELYHGYITNDYSLFLLYMFPVIMYCIAIGNMRVDL